MADYTLTGISMENPDKAETYEVTFTSDHAIGKIVKPNGVLVAAVGDKPGLIVRVGDARNPSLVLVRGIVRGMAGAAAAANATIFSDGDGTASDAEPAGAAGTGVWRLGSCISATRAHIDPQFYEKGA
jgi:hypothetical protein